MADYRYYSIEPKTGVPVQELPLYGTYMDKRLGAAGNLTGFFKLATGVFFDDLLLNGSRPGRYGIVCRRNDVPIWGGMIWGRTYDSSARTIQLTGQTFESIFTKIPVMADFVVDTGAGIADWSVIWNNALLTCEAQASGIHDFDFTYSTPGTTNSTAPTAFTYRAAEWRFWEEMFRYMSGIEDGMTYTINLTNTGDTINKTFRTVRNSEAASVSSGIYYDFPGTVARYWVNENASRAAIRHVGRAIDVSTYDTVPAAVAEALKGTSDPTYPKWYNVYNLSDVNNFDDLTVKTKQLRTENSIPIVSPTFELSEGAKFDGWDKLGQDLTIAITDPRYPSGKTFTERLDGWSLTPGGGDRAETLRLVLKGEEG
jgi:hypothetical protein